MAIYKIFAGLSGGFGGGQYQYTDEFESEEDAEKAAYSAACEAYDSQEGCGCDGWDDFLVQAETDVDRDDFEDDNDYQLALEEWAQQASLEACESWIDYWVIETDDLSDDEYEEPQ